MLRVINEYCLLIPVILLLSSFIFSLPDIMVCGYLLLTFS